VPRCLWLVAVLVAAGAACAPAIAPAPPGVERVVFVGDSLVNRSDQDHGLLGRVRRALERSHPGTALDLVNAGRNGDCIADIRARLAEDVLDAYTEVNRRLCHAHQAVWVDTRHAAFQWLRENARAEDRESGLLTEDGEHLNQAGTDLVADRMASALGHWLGRVEPPRP